MSTGPDTRGSGAEGDRRRLLESRLEPFRRALVRQRLRDAAGRGLHRARRATLCGALAVAAWQALHAAGVWSALPALSWSLVLLVLGALAIAGFATAILGARPWRMAALETARSVDRAFDPADRVTSAWCFLAAERSGPFEELAIEEGVRRIAGYAPGDLPEARERESAGAGAWSLWAVLLALAVCSLFWRAGQDGTAGEDGRRNGRERRMSLVNGAGEAAREEHPVEERRPPSPRRPGSTALGSERSEQRDPSAAPGKAQSGSDRAGEGTSSSEKREAFVAAQGGSAAAGKTQGEQKRREPRPKREARSSKKPGPTPARKLEDAEKTSAVMAAALGSAGSFRAVENPWEDPASAFDREDEGESEEGEVDDEQSESKQRGGLQPSKKDRRASPSRDLSLGLGKKPGNGRGGPSPQKKARGTAALVLGRRLPEFVPGTPNPGTSKVDTQPTQPALRPLEGTRAEVEIPVQRAIQSRLRTDGIPARFADLVRRLFERRAHSTEGQ